MAQTATAMSRKALFASGALRAFLRPKLAQDAKIDLAKIMAGTTAANWKTQKAKIHKALGAATKGKLAQDADLEDVIEMLDTLDDVTDEIGPELADKTDPPAAVDADGEETGKIMAFLKGKISDEDLATLTTMLKPEAAVDETPEAKAEREAKEAKAEKDKDMITKPAMDAAIAAAVTKASATTEAATIARMRSIQEAERAVRPFIGELVVAQDSAAAVYKLALDANEVDVTGVPEAAYSALVKMLRKPDEVRAPRSPHVAMDAAGAKKFAERFPDNNRLAKH